MAKEIPVDLSEGDNLPLGARIRLRRHHRQIRLTNMARDLGYNRGYLSKVENNVVIPSDDLVEKIADFLKISVDDLRLAPIRQLAPEAKRKNTGRTSGFALAAPPMSADVQELGYERQNRSIGERLERLIKMAHLSEEEEKIVGERLVAVTGEILKLVKATRELE